MILDPGPWLPQSGFVIRPPVRILGPASRVGGCRGVTPRACFRRMVCPMSPYPRSPHLKVGAYCEPPRHHTTKPKPPTLKWGRGVRKLRALNPCLFGNAPPHSHAKWKRQSHSHLFLLSMDPSPGSFMGPKHSR